MFTIKIESNLDELIADLKKLEQKFADLSEFWETFTLPTLLQEAEEVFHQEPWPPLNPFYEQIKSQTHPGQPILRRDDTLYHSYTLENAPYSIQEIQPDSLLYGSAVSYASEHEFGATPPADGWGDLPARPVIGNFPPDLDDRIATDLENYVSDLIKTFENS